MTETTIAEPGTSTLVTFMIGPQEYALPVAEVLEIVRLPALLLLPGAPPRLCGLLNRRGRHLPVLDGRTLVGEPASYSLDSQIIIAGHAPSGAQMVPILGLLVDEVRGVHTFEARRLAALGSGTAAPFLRGVVESPERSVTIFDTEALRGLVPDITPAQEPA